MEFAPVASKLKLGPNGMPDNILVTAFIFKPGGNDELVKFADEFIPLPILPFIIPDVDGEPRPFVEFEFELKPDEEFEFEPETRDEEDDELIE